MPPRRIQNHKLPEPSNKPHGTTIFVIIILLVAISILSIRIGIKKFEQIWDRDYVAKANNQIQGTYDLQFQATTQAGLIYTGNTLMLSPHSGVKKITGIPNKDFGDTFIALDQTEQAEGYPVGTTREWRKNGSTATLDLPANHEILHAQLIWSANYLQTTQPELNIESQIDSPITFTTPSGSHLVKPDARFTYNFVQNLPDYSSMRGEYVRTADVTDLVKKQGTGIYSASSVPALLSRVSDQKGNQKNTPDNFAGWTLAVAYRDDNLPIRNISIFTGLQKSVAEVKNNLPALVQGFGTPPEGKLQAEIFVSAGEGDGVLSGDQLRIGKDIDDLQPISSPNNPKDNFFNSLILSKDSILDPRGSFGSQNQTVGTSSYLKRQGWDIATVDISEKLRNGQTSVMIQGTSKGDGYNINSVGMAIDVYAPDITVTLQSDKQTGKINDIITYRTKISNQGSNKATNLNIGLPVPAGTIIIPNSIESSDFPLSPIIDTLQPVSLEELNPDQSISISYQVRINAVEGIKQISNTISSTYKYQMIASSPLLSETSISPTVVTKLEVEENQTISPLTPAKNQQSPQEANTPVTNLPPIATSDQVRVQKNSTTTISVLTNDIDPDGNLDPSTLRIKVNSDNGSTALAGTDQIIYTPNPDFVGEDSFTYEICDTKDSCSTALGIITILPPANSPDSNNQSDQNLPNPEIINTLVQNSQNSLNPEESSKPVDTLLKQEESPDPISDPIIINQPQVENSDTTQNTNPDTNNDQPTNVDNLNLGPILRQAEPQILAEEDKVSTNNLDSLDIFVTNNDKYDRLSVVDIKIEKQPSNGQLRIMNTTTLQYTPSGTFTGDVVAEYALCDIILDICSQAPIYISVTEAPQKPLTIQNPILSNILPRTGGNSTATIAAAIVLIMGLITSITWVQLRLKSRR